MADTRDLIVRIKGDTSSYDKSMKNIEKDSGSARLSISKLAGGVLIGNAAFAAGQKIMQGFGDLVKGTVSQYDDHQKALAQLNAVMKSTGGVAGVSQQQVLAFSDAMQKQTTYDDDAVTGMQNMLLTFTNIGKNVFPQASSAVLDMATAMHQDLQTTAIQVGKALQDPVQGVTALQRVGVRLTDQQKEQVKAMVAAGNAAGAQKLIIGELSREFGGSAAAATDSFSGKMTQLKNLMGDAEKNVGEFVVKGITPLATKLADFLQSDKFQNWLKKVGEFVQAYVIPAFQWIMQVAVPTLIHWGGEMFKVAEKVFNFLKPSLDALFGTIKKDLLPALEKLWKDVLQPLAPIIGGLIVANVWVFINALNIAIKVVSDVIGILSGLVGWVIHTAKSIVSWFSDIPTHIKNAFSGLWDIITWPFRTAFNAVADFWNNTIGKLHWSVPKWIPGLGGHTIGAPQIPKLAAGGIVDSATVAMIGEGSSPEAVIPLDKLPAMVAQINGSQGQQAAPNLHIEVNVGMYAGMPVEKRQIALEIYKELMRAARAQGVQLPQIGAVSPQ